jgi:hypothetical protein
VHLISIDDHRPAYAPIPFEGRNKDQILEQIWMPGVHGDVGGGLEESFLSTLSLLVMIDKLKEHCPELKFDRNYIARTLLPILRKQDIVVSSEWTGIWRIMRRRSVREASSILHHQRHPIVELLQQQQIHYKTLKRFYAPQFLAMSPGIESTVFASDSWHTRRVRLILRRKFEESLPNAKRRGRVIQRQAEASVRW